MQHNKEKDLSFYRAGTEATLQLHLLAVWKRGVKKEYAFCATLGKLMIKLFNFTVV